MAVESGSSEGDVGRVAHRINVCAQCGPTEWEWKGEVWVCPRCGEPAGSRQGETESFAI